MKNEKWTLGENEPKRTQFNTGHDPKGRINRWAVR